MASRTRACPRRARTPRRESAQTRATPAARTRAQRPRRARLHRTQVDGGPQPHWLRSQRERRYRGAKHAPWTPSAGGTVRLYSAYTRRQVAPIPVEKHGLVTTAVAIKLVAVLLTAALGYGAGRFRLLTHGASDSDAARVLSNAALYVFVPALLFRTTARIDYAHMPWRIIAAYFVPVLAVAFLVYAWHHVRSTVAVAAADPGDARDGRRLRQLRAARHPDGDRLVRRGRSRAPYPTRELARADLVDRADGARRARPRARGARPRRRLGLDAARARDDGAQHRAAPRAAAGVRGLAVAPASGCRSPHSWTRCWCCSAPPSCRSASC